jgi:arylsulfatase A
VQRHYWNPELWVDDRPADELGRGKFGDDLFADHVLQVLGGRRDRPCFVYYPMTLVHSQTATGRNFPATPDTLQPGADPDASVEPRQKGFADMVAYMDKLVGRIVAGIEETGLSEKTLVLFCGDNGTVRNIPSDLGDRRIPGGKGKLTEAGTRVPLIVRWAGVTPSGATVSDLVDFSDFLPTLLETAGVALPDGYAVDGRSFLPQLRGEEGQPREWVYRHLNGRWFIRTNSHRLDSDGRLWDLTEDAYFPKPAAETPETAAIREHLEQVVGNLHSKLQR